MRKIDVTQALIFRRDQYIYVQIGGEGGGCSWLISQETRRKYCGRQDLLFHGHLQLPERWHRKDQDSEISDDVEYCSRQVCCAVIDAVACCHQWIPNFLARNTLGNGADGSDQIHDEATPNTTLYCNKKGHVSLSVGHEDP